MKIAFIVPSFPILSETFILNQITGLIDRGHQIDIYAKHCRDTVETHPDVRQYNLLETCTCLPSPPTRRLLCLNEYIRMLVRFTNGKPEVLSRFITLLLGRKIRESLSRTYTLSPLLQKTYDIFQCHYAHSGLLGVHLKKLGCRGKIVTMFHGYDIRAGIAHNGSCYKDLWQHGDCFLSISQYTSEHIIRFGADPLRVVRHPVGIDTTRFPFRSAAIREKKDPARTRFVSVARLVPEKGLSYALKAIKILLTDHPDQAVEYRIIGEGPLRRDLQHQVDELGLTNIVTFLGGVTQSVVREELSSADIFLLPSIAEVLPIALMEAQSTGLPVIATDVGGVREIVLDNRSGYVIPSGNPVILADCLGKIVVQRGCWGEMGKMGSAYIAENFDMKNLNRRLENIYIGLAHDRVPCDLGEK